jgi:hypothetical protein
VKFWLNNPSDGKPSVSLSLMVISFAVAMIISILQVFKQVENGGMCLEIFYATSALYFGNKFTARGKQVEVVAEKIQELDKQVGK